MMTSSNQAGVMDQDNQDNQEAYLTFSDVDMEKLKIVVLGSKYPIGIFNKNLTLILSYYILTFCCFYDLWNIKSLVLELY
jgi:hypothetical protein